MGTHSRQALHDAVLDGDVERVEQLLAAGADPNRADDDGLTPLHFAAQSGSVEAAQLLLDAGAEPNAVNRHGNSSLFVAVFNSRGEGELIRLLRDRGANPNLENLHGQTPVGLARLIGNYAVAEHFADLPE